MAPKMVSMGIKRKDLYPQESPSTKPDKDYENERVRPELDLSGAHAEMMGAEDLKEGDRIRQTIEWVVKRHTATTENGKTRYSMCLALDKASDCEECESPESEKKGGDDDDDGGRAAPSPAMAYIQGRAESAS